MRQAIDNANLFYFDHDEYIYDEDDLDCGIVLYTNMKEWLIENNISYELCWEWWEPESSVALEDVEPAIKFDNEYNAMVFKLRWL